MRTLAILTLLLAACSTPPEPTLEPLERYQWQVDHRSCFERYTYIRNDRIEMLTLDLSDECRERAVAVILETFPELVVSTASEDATAPPDSPSPRD